jgi:hypothetical protein
VCGLIRNAIIRLSPTRPQKRSLSGASAGGVSTNWHRLFNLNTVSILICGHHAPEAAPHLMWAISGARCVAEIERTHRANLELKFWGDTDNAGRA